MQKYIVVYACTRKNMLSLRDQSADWSRNDSFLQFERADNNLPRGFVNPVPAIIIAFQNPSRQFYLHSVENCLPGITRRTYSLRSHFDDCASLENVL